MESQQSVGSETRFGRHSKEERPTAKSWKEFWNISKDVRPCLVEAGAVCSSNFVSSPFGKKLSGKGIASEVSESDFLRLIGRVSCSI